MATPKIVQQQLDAAEALAAAQVQPQQQVVEDVSQLATPVEAPAPAPAAQPTPPAEDWQQKYRSLQGMYQAEVPALRAQTKTYESELIALKEQVRALTVATQKAAEQKPAEIDPRDVSAFGQDMIEMVQKYAAQMFGSVRSEVLTQLQTLEGRIGTLEQTVTGVSKKAESSLETQFYAALTSMVPDWKTINAAEEWLAWLSEVDDVYGAPRQAALDAAHQRGDVERVAAVFNKFKQSRAARPNDSLNSQISPSSGGSGPATPPVQQQRQLITQKAVQAFYNDVARGKYRGREAEADRLEAEINAAAMEGRIV